MARETARANKALPTYYTHRVQGHIYQIPHTKLISYMDTLEYPHEDRAGQGKGISS